VPDQPHQRSLEQLYTTHERSLINVAYRRVWDREDAREVVQDAFVRLWRKRERVDWDRAAGLAYRTVLGLASNRRRGNRVRSAITGWWGGDGDRVAATSGPDVELAAARLDADVRRAIDQLPERLRSVLVMTTFADLDHAAIGAILEIPTGTVGSRRSEAIARVRRALEDRDG